MPLPSSGNSISLNQVNVELGFSGTAQISLDDFLVRALFKVSAGQISMSDGYGKSVSLDLAFTKNLVIYSSGTDPANASLTRNHQFVDSSPSGNKSYSIVPTVPSDATIGQGSFTPFLPKEYWSTCVNLTTFPFISPTKLGIDLGSYVNATTGAIAILDNVEHCVEWWWNPVIDPEGPAPQFTLETYSIFASGSTAFSNSDQYACTVSALSGTVNIYWKGSIVLTATGIAPVSGAGKWTHYAIVKSGSLLYLFMDGVKVATSSSLSTTGATLNVQHILGSAVTTGVYSPTGYFSNFRIVTGSAVYSAAISTNTFTVPYSALSAISGTKLLVFCSSTLKDLSSDSRNLYRDTNALNLSTASFSPFSNKTPYSVATHGGSANFKTISGFPLSNKVYTAEHADLAFSSNYTIEAWVYPDFVTPPSGATTYALPVVRLLSDGGNTLNQVLLIEMTGSYAGTIRATTGGAASPIYDTGGNKPKIVYGQWNHIAICRDATNNVTNGYVNGSYIGQLSGGVSTPTCACYIGGSPDSTRPFNGYISNVRISNILRYTGTGSYTYSLPTAPFTPDSNTLLLFKAENAAISDTLAGSCAITSHATVVEASGAAKFGNAFFDFAPNTVYPTSHQVYIDLQTRPYAPDGMTYELWYKWSTYSNRIVFIPYGGSQWYYPATAFNVPASISAGQWTHMSYTTLLKRGAIYHNGVLTAEFKARSVGELDPTLVLGSYFGGTSFAAAFYGQIDSPRVTQYPRYVGTNTAGFTVPTAAPETSAETIINPSNIVGIGGSKVFDLDGYRYHIYTSSANFYCIKSGTVHAFLVGGGGCGTINEPVTISGVGTVNGQGYGGTGGSVVNNTSVSVTAGTSYQIAIGAGGVVTLTSGNVTGYSAGGNTTGFGLTANGGAYGGGNGAGGSFSGMAGGPGAEYSPLKVKFAAGGGRGLDTSAGSGGSCGYLTNQFIGGGDGGYPSYQIDPEDPESETIPGVGPTPGYMYGSGGGGCGAGDSAVYFPANGTSGIVIVRYAL